MAKHENAQIVTFSFYAKDEADVNRISNLVSALSEPWLYTNQRDATDEDQKAAHEVGADEYEEETPA